MSASYRWTDLVLGRAGHAVLLRQAAATLQAARSLHRQRVARAHAPGQAPPTRRRLDDEGVDAAQSWTRPWRGGLKAEVMRADANPRCVVTSLEAPTPQRLYEDLDGARGTGEKALKAAQNDRRRDRTSATSCLAHALRLRLGWAA